MGLAIDLAGRTALVTGGGNGVGAEIVHALVRAGAQVWVNDIVEARALEVVERTAGGPGTARAVKADVTSPVKIARMREETGPVDILVNNAGIPTGGFELQEFVASDPDDWEYTMRLNLGAVLHVTHAYIGAMVERGWGRVVTIVSDAARRGERGQVIYGAAKAGAAGFVRGLAAEVGRAGVTANCVALGAMKTGPLLDAIAADPDVEPRLARAYPTGRLGEPRDPAALVALLCGDAGEWITGQLLPVDGGYLSAL